VSLVTEPELVVGRMSGAGALSCVGEEGGYAL
jgi:hypothetical protein